MAVSGFTSHQPILADVDGDLKSELLGMGKAESGTSFQFWKEKAGEFERYAVVTSRFKRNCAYSNNAVTDRYELPLEPSSRLCRLAEPHSNAFVDLDGDCLPGKFMITTAFAEPQSTC
jgi:integrin alpha FG-GAP repeat containing protein 1